MKLYGVSKVTLVIESEEVTKETSRQFHLETGLSAYDYKRRVPKNDPMLAFGPEEALEKFEEYQLEIISSIESKIALVKDSITKAKANALH